MGVQGVPRKEQATLRTEDLAKEKNLKQTDGKREGKERGWTTESELEKRIEKERKIEQKKSAPFFFKKKKEKKIWSKMKKRPVD